VTDPAIPTRICRSGLEPDAYPSTVLRAFSVGNERLESLRICTHTLRSAMARVRERFKMLRLVGVLIVASLAGGIPDALGADATLRVIVASDERPETFALKDSEEAGLERELLQGFARLRGMRFEAIVAPTHGDRIRMLTERQGDVIAAIFDTPDRRQQVAFTRELMPTYDLVVTLAPTPAIDSLEDLRRATVAVQRGTEPASAAIRAGVLSSRLMRLPLKTDVMAALRGRLATAAVMSVSEYALALKEEPALRGGVRVGEPGRVAWAVRKEDLALRTALDEYLANIRLTPTWSRLIVKYFGEKALIVLGKRTLETASDEHSDRAFVTASGPHR
jgi:ABC-type amino acid transport substrate-binding protein